MEKEEEKFNTLDLLEYDIKENKLSLFKNGSGTTYLKRGAIVEKIQSENLEHFKRVAKKYGLKIGPYSSSLA